jgi:phage terminase small subunit
MSDLPTENLQMRAVMLPPAPPKTRRLTLKQETFARRYAWHGNATQAYREAFRAGAMRPNIVSTKAYQELHKPHVAERIRQFMAEAAEGTTISARARMVRLQEILEADPGEIVRVIAECCRWCHGTGHAYQWIDTAEYAQALKFAHAANQAYKRAGRAERPLPTDEGGHGFNSSREPHEGCPRCRGEGTKRVVVTPTEQLSPAARKLLKGIRQKSTGEIEVRMHDQLEACDQLNRMQGAYIDRSVTVMAHVNAPALDKLTREEQLQFLESLRPAT